MPRRYEVTDRCTGGRQICDLLGLLELTDWSEDEIVILVDMPVGTEQLFDYCEGAPTTDDSEIQVKRLTDVRWICTACAQTFVSEVAARTHQVMAVGHRCEEREV